MSRLVLVLATTVLAAYAAGMVIGPPSLGGMGQHARGLSPFFIISAAVLIASIGYTIAGLRGIPRTRFFDQRRRDRDEDT